MARRIGAPRSFVVTGASNLDLGDVPGDVTTGMLCPADGARVVRVSYTIRTAGIGAAANHELELEHGLGAAGVAMTPVVAVDADAVAGTITSGDGLDAQPNTVEGTVVQIKNVESAAITNGAFVDVSVLWQL